MDAPLLGGLATIGSSSSRFLPATLLGVIAVVAILIIGVIYAPLPELLRVLAFCVWGILIVFLVLWMFKWATRSPAGAGESYFVAVANQGIVFGTDGNLLPFDRLRGLPAETNPNHNLDIGDQGDESD